MQEGKKIVVSVRLKEELVSKIDQIARENNVPRSEVIMKALVWYMEKRGYTRNNHL
ncbi:hypothetical protein HS7_08440 [Sulfolobales archaeon HS-7]|nr:hypothetical protein HS7_08440 [Sulfolobales archaeon HS-7]